MKKSYSLATIVIVLILLAIVYLVIPKQQMIGGERDANGCLAAAGYSWNEAIKACIRQWEINSSDKINAAKIVAENLSYSLTIIEIIPANCVGCYAITAQNNENLNQIELILKNWTIISKTVFTEEIKENTAICGNGKCEEGEDTLSICPTSNCEGSSCPPCQIVCPQDCDNTPFCQKCEDRCVLIESVSALDCKDSTESFSCEYTNGKCDKITLENCAKSGEEGDVHGKKCCSELTAVPINEVPINGTCLNVYPPYGTQFYCINCGNNLCEEKENECNCPEDCV